MDLNLPEIFFPLLDKSYRYRNYIWYGGRGGAKSRSIGTGLIMRACESKEIILCCREIQNSIKDSVKKLLENEIKRLGLQSVFKITLDSIICTETESEFLFKGLRGNIDSVKSTEGVTIVWVEEAHTLSQYSIDVLWPTIREAGSEIWASYNPKFETDPIHRKFVIEEPPPRSLVIKVTFRDNPWFPEELREEMEHDRKTDHDKYLHKWEGECMVSSEEQIFSGKWQIASVPEPPENIRLHYGLDFGFSVSPSAGIRSWIDKDKNILYIDYESYKDGLEIDRYEDLLSQLPDSDKWPIIADSARPDTISYINKNTDYQIIGARKPPGSLEDGISYLKGYTIIVDPRCKRIIEEFTKYSWKKDKQTDIILPIIVKEWDHGIDALRYSHERKSMLTGLISEEIVEEAFVRQPPAEVAQLERLVVGVYYGDHEAIVTIRQGPLVSPQKQLDGDVEDVAQAIIDAYLQATIDAIFVDTSTTNGSGLYTRLSNLHYKPIAVNPNRIKQGNAGKYYDANAEMWYRMLNWLPAGTLPRSATLKNEMCLPIPISKSGGKLGIESIKEQGKRTSDSYIRGFAQSLVTTFAYMLPPSETKRYLTQAQKDRRKVTGIFDDVDLDGQLGFDL